MITFLASPKPFTGRVGELQRRAVESWRRVHPEAEIILYGSSSGTPEIAASLDLRHVPEIASSPSGVPRFDAIAGHAAAYAKHDLQVFLNSDILFPPDFLQRIAPVDLPKFLVVGQRIDLTEGVVFDSSRPDWPAEIRALSEAGQAELHTPTGVDYFVFRRGTWTGLAPLIVGRGGYDGALVAYCLRRGIPVIDATWAVPALHQYHDYAHVTGGLAEAHRGTEARQNCRLHDVEHSMPDIADADYQLRDGQLVAQPCRGDRLRACEITLRHRRGLKYASYPARAIWRLTRFFGYNPTVPINLNDLLNAYATASRL
jgi:hypothetical protein